MDIAVRIKQLRKTEMLTQREFAERLGVKGPYISELESGKYKPSEQLFLSICRAFRVRIEWLKEGRGAMYDTTPVFTAKGQWMLEEITKRLTSDIRQVPVSLVAEILGIDIEKFPEEKEKTIKYDDSVMRALKMLMMIYREGNKTKIDAVLAQLKALIPSQEEEAPLEEKTKKKA